MACPNCTPASSIYDLACVDCGVRLVKSARSPDTKTSRRLQNQHLAAIEHCAGVKVKDAVIERLREGA